MRDVDVANQPKLGVCPTARSLEQHNVATVIAETAGERVGFTEVRLRAHRHPRVLDKMQLSIHPCCVAVSGATKS